MWHGRPARVSHWSSASNEHGRDARATLGSVTLIGNLLNHAKISEPQAYRLLRKLFDKSIIEINGKGRGVYYTLKRTEKTRE